MEPKENNQLAKAEQFDVKALVGYLDSMGLAQMMNEKEKVQFIEIAKAFELNPFKREIYCVKYKADSPLSIIVGYETYIKRAERSKMLDGWNVVTEGKTEDNSLKAIITIYRKDRKHPFVHEVFYSEYVQKANDGKPNKFWQKAQTMTKKVAIAQGFRLCFSDELGGMPYTSEEINDTEQELIPNDPNQIGAKAVEPSKIIPPEPKLLATPEQVTDIENIKKNLLVNEKELKWINDVYPTASINNIAEFIKVVNERLIEREAAEIKANS